MCRLLSQKEELMRARACGVLAIMAALALPCRGQAVPNNPATHAASHPRLAQVPYTATYQLTTVQIRDGHSHSTTAAIVEASDSQGRFYRLTTEIPYPGAMGTITQGYVQDRVAQTRTDWNVERIGEQQNGQVEVWHQAAEPTSCPPAPAAQLPTKASNPAEPAPDARAQKIHQAFEEIRAQVREKYPLTKTTGENLGLKTIKGIEVHGDRTTITSYTGINGPSETIFETWRDMTPGLFSIKVLDSQEGPERKFRKELMSITLGEPDPALFKPPAGLAVEEHQPPACPAVVGP